MGRLDGKICIVTGAAQGIGRAIAERFAQENAKAVYAVDLQDAQYDNPVIRAEKFDTTDRERVNALVSAIVAEHGRIDVVVNNAGITRDALVNKMTDEQWDLVVNVNLKAPYLMAAAVGPHMMEAGTGSIINISSIIGLYGNVGQTNYAATKAGVIAMAKSWTKEFSRRGGKIRCNSICPGFISTPILASMPETVLDKMRQLILFGELGKPEDIANAALFLASDESSYVTGQALEVSGGFKI